jgi:gluconolactonase
MSQPTPDRRTFLATAAAVTALGGLTLSARARDYGKNAQPARYPDADIVVLDKRFASIKIGNAAIERLYTGMRWAEGPAWNAQGRFLFWSDIPNNVQMRWLNEDGHVSTFRNPSHYSNGNTMDFEGRQIAFEHGPRTVARYEHDGKRTVLAEKFNGKRLNAPNDGAVHPDGGIWFTDPGYGALMSYEGVGKAPLEIEEAVYRIDPKSGKLEKLIGRSEMFKPNGLCFSPDYKKVYICDTGASHYEKAPKNIMVFDVEDGKKVKNGKQYISMEMEVKGEKKAGFADGIRADTEGNIWVGGGWVGDGYDGVHVFAPDGTRIGLILLPEICANVCFGGPKRNRLFMCGSQSLYSVYVEAQGAHIC